jgi:hypothetical protein
MFGRAISGVLLRKIYDPCSIGGPEANACVVALIQVAFEASVAAKFDADQNISISPKAIPLNEDSLFSRLYTRTKFSLELL